VVLPKPHQANLEIVSEITKRPLRSKQPPYKIRGLPQAPSGKSGDSVRNYKTTASFKTAALQNSWSSPSPIRQIWR